MRRLRTSPKLTDFQKLQRFIWCHKYKDVNLENYVFVDETTLIVYEKPKYQLRLPSSRPEALTCSSKFESKIHI